MKRLHFLLPALVGTFIYVLVSLAGGQNSFWAERQLELQKVELSLHTAEIQKINNELSLEYIALQKDPDVIAAYAKKLGYVGDNEKLVKISGLKSAPVTLYNTGVAQKRQKVFFISERICKLVGLVFSLLTFLIILLVRYERKLNSASKEKVSVVKGIPLYDLPQI